MAHQRKIRILHLLLSLETGGMERFVFEHCLGLDKNRFNASVCCIDRLGGFYDELVEEGIQVDLLQKNQKKFDLFFPIRLQSFLRKKTIDILHIHSGAFFYGSLAGSLARTPGIIYTEHGRQLIEPKVIYILDKLSSFFADKIITVSSTLEKHLVDNIKLSKGKIKTITNGVNTTIFSPRDKPVYLLKEFSVDPECKIIGTVARLAEIKDQFTLIKAFKSVKNRFSNSKLIIVGEGPCAENLRVFADELNLSEDIIFTGNRKDIPELLNLFDVFVLPSLMEGTSISLLEAMASGTPVVATNVGGNSILIKNNANGYLVGIGEFAKMAKKIIKLIEEKDICSGFVKSSLTEVRKNYSLVSNIRNYQSLYEEILAGK